MQAFYAEFRGPVKKRRCTDVVCCILFFFYIIFYFLVSWFAFVHGRPGYIRIPIDSFGRVCGHKYPDYDLTDRRVLFYFDISECRYEYHHGCPSVRICIDKCPTQAWTYPIAENQVVVHQTFLGYFKPQPSIVDQAKLVDWSHFYCVYGYKAKDEFINWVAIRQMSFIRKCAPYYVPTRKTHNRCLPAIDMSWGDWIMVDLKGHREPIVDGARVKVSTAAILAGKDQVLDSLKRKEDPLLVDLMDVWPWVLILFVVSVLLSFFWIVGWRWLSSPVVWFTLLLFLAFCIFGIYFSHGKMKEIKHKHEKKANPQKLEGKIFDGTAPIDPKEVNKSRPFWISVFVFLIVTTTIISFVIILLRKRIIFGAEILYMSSEAMSYVTSTFLFPFTTFFLIVIVIFFWGFTALLLYTSLDTQDKYFFRDERGPLAADLTGHPCGLPGPNMEWFSPTFNLFCEKAPKEPPPGFIGKHVVKIQYIIIIGMLWQVSFILALGQFTLAGAYSYFYWTWSKSTQFPAFPVYRSFVYGLRYHCGGLALGAWLLPIFGPIRVILEYKNGKSKVVRYVIMFLCFPLLVFERCVMQISRNGYIVMALFGTSFCTSAKYALSMMKRNADDVMTGDVIVDFILTISKMTVMIAMGLLTWALFTKRINVGLPIPEPSYLWIPIMIVAFATYAIATGFFNLFGMAADTIFICFLEDWERNDGSAERPYYMTSALYELLAEGVKVARGRKAAKEEAA